MPIALLIRNRLKELGLGQRDLARAAHVTESYISQLLAEKKLPPASNRTDMYGKIGGALQLPEGQLAKLADLQRHEHVRKRLGDQPGALLHNVRELILRKCHPGKHRQIRTIFEKQPFGELERFVTQKLLGVVRTSPGRNSTTLWVARLLRRRELVDVATVEGFCDGIDDRRHFGEGQFDAILSRQLVNGLFDPLAAFRNWLHWLKPGGAAVVIDGLYGRSAWSGIWQEEVDVLPLAACQSTAMVPYLMEVAGFRVEVVRFMEAVNARPSTVTSRYIVVARK